MCQRNQCEKRGQAAEKWQRDNVAELVHFAPVPPAYSATATGPLLQQTPQFP